jgi:HEAT repeat protein
MPKSLTTCLLAAALVLAGAAAAFSAESAAYPKFEVKKATYEAVDGSQGGDVTAKVKALIKDGALALDVSNTSLGGDAAPQKQKHLRVEYTLDGKPMVAVAKEGERMAIPALPPMTPEQLAARAVAVLKNADATQKEKADACRDLAHLSTKDAIPALAALLADEKLSHMARYGLETLPDPAVDDILRDMLGKVKGRLLTGMIGSLGVRRDPKSVEPIARFLADADLDVAEAAAKALGKIGTVEAAKVIEAAMAKAPKVNRLPCCEGLFRCAEAIAAKGQQDEARGIYDRLRGLEGAAHQVRTGALRGAILMRGKDGLPLLIEAARGDDYVLVEAAARTAMEMKSPEVAKALAAEVGNFAGDKKILFIQVLGNLGDKQGLPAVLAAAKAGDKAVRIAAIRVITQIPDASSVPVLIGLLKDSVTEVAKAAQEGLAVIQCPEADTAIAAMLGQGDAKTRALAIELIGQRRAAGATPTLLKTVEDADEGIRIASIKVLNDLGTGAEVPAMVSLIVKAKSPAEMQAAEDAASAICLRQQDRAASADKVVAGLAQAQGPAKLALLRLLRSVGGPKALAAVRAASKDSNAEIKDTALRAMCEWQSVEALPDVTELAKTAKDTKFKVLALRGYIRLIALQDVAADKKLAALKNAMAMCERKEEKRLVLAALGGIPTAESLALVVQNISNPDLKDEASLAAVAIGEKIADSQPAQVNEAMKQVTAATTNQQILKKAKALETQTRGK